MWLLAETMTSEVMFGLGIVMLIFILFNRSFRKRAKKSNTTSTATTQPRSDLPLVDAPPDMVRWQVEMHDFARDMKAELNSKMGALQSLIHMANVEVARLEEVIERAEQCDHHGTVAARQPNPLEQLPGDRKQRELVYAMADIGEPSETIAVAAGTSVGEVEMMLSCRGTDD